MQAGRRGLPRSRQTLRTRFRTACRALGVQRVRELTIHHGRHTFVSHALAGGPTLAEARDAAGHSSAWVTSAYLHVAIDDDGTVGQLFRYDRGAVIRSIRGLDGFVTPSSRTATGWSDLSPARNCIC